MFFHLQKSDIDWGYYTEPSENYCLGFHNRSCYWPRGKTLGGTSAMNAMVYIRGNRKDYDSWASAGNDGWSYDEVINFFKISEDMRAFQVLEQDYGHFHNTTGELKVDNYFDSESSIKQALLEAGHEMGLPFVYDINSDSKIGITMLQGTVDHGTRCSSSKAFLTHKQNNLHVIKHAMVTKILINKYSNWAIGVQYNRKGKSYTVWSTKEVISSAGAINTPQLLMLSGIGPEQHLRDLNIPLVTDLPVGENLQDHVFLPIWLLLKKSNGSISRKQKVSSIFDYYINHDGPLSGINITNIGAFFNTDEPTSLYPNTQLHFVYNARNDDSALPLIIDCFGYVNSIRRSLIQANKQGDTLLTMLSILNPKSKGYLKLRSRNPIHHPKIYPNYLDHPDDMRIALNAVKFMEQFVQTKGMQNLGAQIINLDIPNCRDFEVFGDEYWKCFIRNTATTEYHPSSTAKMGPSVDKTAVVDERLRVHNVKGLRVADASIMPNITSGNLNAPTIMIGEKAAFMIKEDWKN